MDKFNIDGIFGSGNIRLRVILTCEYKEYISCIEISWLYCLYKYLYFFFFYLKRNLKNF